MLSYGGMEANVARRNYDLFVSSVLPHLKQYDVGGDIGVQCVAQPARAAE
jgi:hypothetical protein